MEVIAGIFAGIGAISALIGGRKASRDAKRAGKKEEALEKMVTAEKIRQIGIEEEVMRGETIAQVAGSGVLASIGSPLAVLAEQRREVGYKRDITSRVGATKAQAALDRAGMVANQAKYSSYGSAANQFASMFGLFG